MRHLFQKTGDATQYPTFAYTCSKGRHLIFPKNRVASLVFPVPKGHSFSGRVETWLVPGNQADLLLHLTGSTGPRANR